MEIIKTNNYDNFELINTENGHNISNRPINWNRVSHLREELKSKNLTSAFMIKVNSKKASKKRYNASGKKYCIVDGQHRFLACKLEELPFHYLVNDTLHLKDVPKAASVSKGWSLRDFLHTYVSEGKNDYIAFEGYMRTNNFAPSLTLVILCGSRSRHSTKSFINGELQITRDWEFSNAFANAISDFGDYINFNRHARFAEALLIAFQNDKYDHQRMMTKVEYLSGKMKRCADTKMHLEQLEEIYNYNSRDKVRLNLLRDIDKGLY